MRFARWVFTLGGIWGILIVAPMYALEGYIAANDRGPNPYPETYYGFVGAVVAWQLVYLIVGRDPARFRPLMLVGVFAKLSFILAVWTLFAMGRTPLTVAIVSSPDALLAALFLAAWIATRPAESRAQGPAASTATTPGYP